MSKAIELTALDLLGEDLVVELDKPRDSTDNQRSANPLTYLRVLDHATEAFHHNPVF